MPLDTTRPPTKLDAIAESFAGIAIMPRAKSNVEATAVEYLTASTLLSLAEKRRERAAKDATAAGVLPDHAKAPLSVGVHPRVYAGELVEISATVVEQAERLDGAALVTDLLAAGVKAPLLRRLVAKHTKRFNPSHRYSATLIGN